MRFPLENINNIYIMLEEENRDSKILLNKTNKDVYFRR